MRKIHLPVLFIVLLFTNCGNKNSDFREIRDKNLTLQLQMLKPGDGTFNFKCRLVPSGSYLEKEALQNTMWYHMDSCFYLLQGQNKIYPEIEEPVANGVRNSYEYLLSFEPGQKPADSLTLVYEDHFFNHKVYRFTSIKF